MKILLSILVFVSCNTSFAGSPAETDIDRRKIGSFAPDNEVNIPEHGPVGQLMAWSKLKSGYGIAEGEFNAVLDRIYNHYQPKLQAKGLTLVFKRQWTNSTANSDTYVQGNQFIINSYGGLARHPAMNAVGYATVACHELGHHLGGAPLYPGETWNGGGPSNEGESDYWASKDCMKDVGFSEAEIRAGALSCASTLAALGGSAAPSPDRKNPGKVSRTNDAHPEAQCRLDTYLAGLDCSVRGEMSNTNPKVNSCYYYNADGSVAHKGSRPRCWFAPIDQGSPPPGENPVPTPTPVPVPTPVPSPTPGPTPPPRCPPVPPPQCPPSPTKPCRECKWLCL